MKLIYRIIGWLVLLTSQPMMAEAITIPTIKEPLADAECAIKGIVVSENQVPVVCAMVSLKGTPYVCTTDNSGCFNLKAPQGNYTLVVASIGYQVVERPIVLTNGESINLEICSPKETIALGEAVVVASSVEKVKNSAFNAVAVDAKDLMNSTKSLSEALIKLPGIKLRESGGVGSDMQFMLDGFSGKHVKVFIDGVPQEGAGMAFGLNNIPVSFADRIEVYKGVVPVEFGSDALGGVINVVSKKQRRSWFLDAAYSYGSFNTHKSHVNFGRTLKNGLSYEVNAFQNYSDNNYHVNSWVREFEVREDGSVRFPPVDKTKVQRVERFNDTYHNETVIGKIGFVNKLWADRLMVSLGFSNFYKEIQTGIYQETVFGDKHRKGYSWMPAFEYKKRNLLIQNLDLTLTANYNHNVTHNVDTTSLAFNWAGLSYDKGSKGEQSFQQSESLGKNWNATMGMNYRIGSQHMFALNHVFSSFQRTSRRTLGNASVISNFDIPKKTHKHITGLSYRFQPSDRWNITAFGKYYNQYNKGPVSTSVDGVGNYIEMSKNVNSLGYGVAGTYYLLEGLQAKLSYEKAYRLPNTDELFGDDDLEAGKTDLKPENSHNLNFNLSYTRRIGKHAFYWEGCLIYRDTKDFIKRGIGKHGAFEYGFYENHGRVMTRGYNLSLRYNFSDWLNIGGTFNQIDTRDNERYIAGGTLQQNLHYKVRLPNIPYCYANWDATLTFKNLLAEANQLSITYDNFWQKEFSLYWENMGDSDSKAKVPEQFSHNLSLTYSIQNGKYNLSFECRNLTDAKLYDNFSLQKAGRAFYGKVRIYLSGK